MLAGRISDGNAEGLELGTDSRSAVDVTVVGFQVVLIDLILEGDDLTDLEHDFDPGVLLAAAKGT